MNFKKISIVYLRVEIQSPVFVVLLPAMMCEMTVVRPAQRLWPLLRRYINAEIVPIRRQIIPAVASIWNSIRPYLAISERVKQNENKYGGT